MSATPSMPGEPTASDSAHERSPVTPLLVVVGVCIFVWGVIGVFRQSDDTHPLELATWVIGLDVVHDALLVPLALGVAWVVRRVLPDWARPPALAAAAMSGLFLVVGWPFIAGYGRNPAVPSLLNRNYAHGVLAYVSVIVVGCIGWAVVRWRAASRRQD